jgi:hypothetical protein
MRAGHGFDAPMTRDGATMHRVRLYALSLLAWLGLLVVAVVNGAAREILLSPWFGGFARPVSGITAMIAFAAAIFWFVRRLRPTVADAVGIGLVWLVLTLVAEALMMRAAGRPAADVIVSLGPSAIADGDLFALLVAWTAIAPALFAWRGRPRLPYDRRDR